MKTQHIKEEFTKFMFNIHNFRHPTYQTLHVCTCGSLVDIWACEVSLHCKLTKGEAIDSGVFVHVSCACCMLDNVFLVFEGGKH